MILLLLHGGSPRRPAVRRALIHGLALGGISVQPGLLKGFELRAGCWRLYLLAPWP